MADFPRLRSSGELAESLPGTPYLRWVLTRMMEQTYLKSPHFDTWDVQWHYALTRMHALAVAPYVNLVSNIGGTGTHEVDGDLCGRPFGELPPEITFPSEPYAPDSEADLHTLRKIYSGNWRMRLRYLAWLILPKSQPES